LLRTTEAESKLHSLVQSRRQQVMTDVANHVQYMLKDAYAAARHVEQGTGVKQRMLDTLKRHVDRQAPHIFSTIRGDMREGVAELREVLLQSLQSLTQESAAKLDRIRQNI